MFRSHLMVSGDIGCRARKMSTGFMWRRSHLNHTAVITLRALSHEPGWQQPRVRTFVSFCLWRIIPFLLVISKNKYFLGIPTLVGKIKKVYLLLMKPLPKKVQCHNDLLDTQYNWCHRTHSFLIHTNLSHLQSTLEKEMVSQLFRVNLG